LNGILIREANARIVAESMTVASLQIFKF